MMNIIKYKWYTISAIADFPHLFINNNRIQICIKRRNMMDIQYESIQEVN